MPESFTRKFDTNGGVTEFSFLRMVDRKNIVIFFVSTLDKNRVTKRFKMTVDKGVWKIKEAAALPQWIKDIEVELSKAIIENNPIE
jgi:hypothetical protein